MSNQLEQEIDLQKYIESCENKSNACIGKVEILDDRVAGLKINYLFRYIKFDANGNLKVKDLANVLADHVIEYCFSVRRRGTPVKPHEYAKLSREARQVLRKIATSGESGEMLLYLLIETFLKAPQVVAKYDLKTNPNMEVFGSDGIHMKWCNRDKLIDIYFGEAKLMDTIYNALDSAIKSLEYFHSEGLLEHELGLVTSHFKWTDQEVRDQVVKYIDRHQPGSDCRINHACLIGYNWDEYNKLQADTRDNFIAEFVSVYKKDIPRLKSLFERRISNSKVKHMQFEVFFLPFSSVQEFRDAFVKAVG